MSNAIGSRLHEAKFTLHVCAPRHVLLHVHFAYVMGSWETSLLSSFGDFFGLILVSCFLPFPLFLSSFSLSPIQRSFDYVAIRLRRNVVRDVARDHVCVCVLSYRIRHTHLHTENPILGVFWRIFGFLRLTFSLNHYFTTFRVLWLIKWATIE